MKQPISLVLSSGGARGLAHIGVIECLEESGYEIQSIAGTSMGALVGGLYAAGKLDVYKEWVCNLDKLDVFKLVDFTFSTQGFIRGERVFREIERFISDCNIEDLKIPFAAVATDIINRKEVIFNKGSLFEAIRASVAIPTVFTPYVLDGKELVDGGVLNPIPIDVVKRVKNDLLVVSNVNAPISYEKTIVDQQQAEIEELAYKTKMNLFWAKWQSLLPKNEVIPKKMGFFQLMNKSFDLMQDKLSNLIINNYNPDIVINISRNSCGTFEFYKAKELIEEGRCAFKRSINLEEIKT